MLKSHILACLIVLAPLGACSTIPTAGIERVSLTTIQVATAVNDTYAALSDQGRALAQAGIIPKERFKALDAQAYAIVVQVRRAKDMGDTAFNYADALTRTIALNKELVK